MLTMKHGICWKRVTELVAKDYVAYHVFFLLMQENPVLQVPTLKACHLAVLHLAYPHYFLPCFNRPFSTRSSLLGYSTMLGPVDYHYHYHVCQYVHECACCLNNYAGRLHNFVRAQPRHSQSSLCLIH